MDMKNLVFAAVKAQIQNKTQNKDEQWGEKT